jgi:hypothetical protein
MLVRDVGLDLKQKDETFCTQICRVSLEQYMTPLTIGDKNPK